MLRQKLVIYVIALLLGSLAANSIATAQCNFSFSTWGRRTQPPECFWDDWCLPAETATCETDWCDDVDCGHGQGWAEYCTVTYYCGFNDHCQWIHCA